jgi:hypothetical protein
MVAIAVASLFMAAPENMQNLTTQPAGGLLPLQHRRIFFTRGACPLWVNQGAFRWAAAMSASAPKADIAASN